MYLKGTPFILLTGKLPFQFQVIFLCIFMAGNVLSQDIHFSQYLSAPFNLNPALTGDFKGDYRILANYRNQWNSITVPYNTYGAAGDFKGLLGFRDLNAGASVFYDKTGDSKFNTLIFQIPVSYGYPLNTDSTQMIYFGIMPGFVRQAFNYDGLSFDNQYNNQTGRYDPTLPTRESYGNTSATNFNLSWGARWGYNLGHRHKVEAGFSMYNMLEPTNSLTNDGSSNLSRRYNLHANYQVKLIEKMDLLPGLLYTDQGTGSELLLGTSARYLYNGYTAFHLGYWYRNSDAGFASVGLTYQTFYIGLSYDINTSKLREASRGRGAFEISLIYVFRKFRLNQGKYLSCPNYL